MSRTLPQALPDPLVGPLPGRTPSHPWRGILIDSARTRHSVESIELILQLAHRYGFNRLHWHLNDDQGWRFPVPGYPKLVDVAATLPRDDFLRYDDLFNDTQQEAIRQAPGRWHNGLYSEEEIDHLLQLADSLGIVIVPELDFPGHMGAAIAAYPELGRPTGVPIPSSGVDPRWAARNDLLWPHQSSLDLIRASLTQVATLFPSPHIHIGGDECAFAKWEADPELMAWAESKGIDDGHGIQQWFMEYGIAVLRELGKEPIVWDEAAPMVDDVLVIAWDEQRSMDRIRDLDHHYIYADARTLYFNRVEPEQSQQKGMTPPIDVLDVLSAPWPEAQSPRCVGVQCCLWSEFMLDGADLFDMALPRLLALAERLWEPNLDPLEAKQRVLEEYDQLLSAGIIPR